MKSPFPGMDPFIEACGLWEDFHSHLIEAIADTLSAEVPEKYVVRTGERAYVVVAESEGNSTEFRETFIEIHALHPNRHLVTCLEVLSPSNKRPGTSGWELYLRKRQGLLLGEANLVEMDLLRGGQKPPMLDPWPICPFTILVARRAKAPLCRVWRAHLDRPLPVFPVPLAHPDPDLTLNIQPMVDAIYSHYRYDRDIDYSQRLSPPLNPDEMAWLAEQLPKRD